ncbi:CDP-alcohol phosphatidyltransferase family protein [Saprospiraceae bacterium]|nr:CDP-alcohol phosphatidyltransferase family protein [Saprospiraceae bacterium]
MSKLPKQYQFVDLSDYGRGTARWIAAAIKDTKYTPIHVTTWFIISGLLAIACIINHYFLAAAFFLVLKSILDAADGELSRLKNTPSYVGRFYDSIADYILNFLFLLSIWYICDGPFYKMLVAFVCIQLQGTLYNYYYVIFRNNVNGDSTSRIFEDVVPSAMKGEKQSTVATFYHIYNTLYIIFDKIIYWMDRDAIKSQPFPRWFMTCISIYGLGFQLLVMAIMLSFQLETYIIPFFIIYTIFLFVFIAIRKFVLD